MNYLNIFSPYISSTLKGRKRKEKKKQNKTKQRKKKRKKRMAVEDINLHEEELDESF